MAKTTVYQWNTVSNSSKASGGSCRDPGYNTFLSNKLINLLNRAL
jgi:hypothetical protein